MKETILSLMALLFVTQNARAIELRELSLDYKNYAIINDKARNMLLYPEHPKEGIVLNMDTDVWGPLYWNNQITTYTTGAQYRSIGWHFWLGLSVSRYLDLGYEHQSQHLLDAKHSYMDKFPCEDNIFIKMYLYKTKNEKETVF